MVSAPSGSTWTISAGRFAKPAPSRASGDGLRAHPTVIALAGSSGAACPGASVMLAIAELDREPTVVAGRAARQKGSSADCPGRRTNGGWPARL